MHQRIVRGAWLLAPLLLVSCRGDSIGPSADDHQIAVQGGDQQVGPVGGSLEDPLQVVVEEVAGDEPVAGATVEWSIVSGPAGATLSATISATNSTGIASTLMTLGPDTGTYRIRASSASAVNDAVEFTARAVLAPTITSIVPSPVDAGDTVTITGTNFSPVPLDNRVLFGGIAGSVLTATTTVLTVVVPQCLPTSTVEVVVRLGSASSPPVNLGVVGDGSTGLQLQPGQATTFFDPADLTCVRLPASASVAFLLVPQNAADAANTSMPFQLVGVGGGTVTAPVLSAASFDAAWAAEDIAVRFERRLRESERAILPSMFAQPAARANAQALLVPPQVGDRRTFSVLNKDNTFTSILAEVKAVGTTAVIYQDLDAPTNGFTSTEFQNFVQLFDNPIFPTDVAVYGSPSDIDDNDLVIILFTPVVNEMTPPGSAGFIAGFFYAWDLTTNPGSNQGEVFYSVVPDPAGIHGDARSRNLINAVVPPVLAHEFQHMIHFYQRVMLRGGGPEALWLSEGLAHMAEDLVGDAFLASGQNALADQFKASNFIRALRYMENPTGSSLIAISGQGTLEERGAAWLFLRYLMGHYGGVNLITQLTQTTSTSVNNITGKTGSAWNVLFANWSIALWADDAEENGNAPPGFTASLNPLHTIPNLNLRQAFAAVGWPLQPHGVAYQDFVVRDTLPSASMDYVRAQASASNTQPLNLSLTGAAGGAFAAGTRPQFSVLRIQ